MAYRQGTADVRFTNGLHRDLSAASRYSPPPNVRDLTSGSVSVTGGNDGPVDLSDQRLSRNRAQTLGNQRAGAGRPSAVWTNSK